MNKETAIRIITEVLSFLDITANELAKNLGINRSQSIYDILNPEKKVGVSKRMASNIAEKYPMFNLSWLLTGEGEMLKTSQSEPPAIGNARPFIDYTYGALGVPNGFSIAVKADECENIVLPFIHNYDFSLRGRGDSMINRDDPKRSINDGDIIACKFWNSRSHVRWGEVYVLSTNDGVIVKKIVKSELENHIKCVSYNLQDGYEPYDLPTIEIHDWAIVVGVVCISNW